MKITFLMPCYLRRPSGGFRVVYEFSNRLVARGHEVAVVHPRRLLYVPRPRLPLWKRLRIWPDLVRTSLETRRPNWHGMDPRVAMLWVPTSHYQYIPQADVLFATGWQTVSSVLACPVSKGQRFYLIQGYECWLGPKESVDATWRAPLQKVVVAKWLLTLSTQFGDPTAVYVPNAIDRSVYCLNEAIENRPRRIAMLYSPVPVKGSLDALAALELVHARHPDLQASLFGTGRRPSGLPQWAVYYCCPRQQFLVQEIYNHSIIYLNASLSEGWNLPLAEAAACGCALVATDIPGNRERILHGVTGLLSSPRDPLRLAENVCRLLADDNFRIQLARNAHAATTVYDWEHSTSCLEEAISQRVRQPFVPASFSSQH